MTIDGAQIWTSHTVFNHRLDVFQRNDAAQVFVVDVHHVWLGDFAGREERALRSADVGARLFAPVRQPIESIESIKVAKLHHSILTQARVDRRDLRQRAISLRMRKRDVSYETFA